jgi:antitoxin ParD1/3/4
MLTHDKFIAETMQKADIQAEVEGLERVGNRLAEWQSAIKLGDDQLDRGEGLAYTARTLKDITQSAIDAMHSGQPMNPDVLP